MNTPSFHEGDFIRCINVDKWSHHFTEGNIYIVDRIEFNDAEDHHRGGWVIVQRDDRENTSIGNYADCFELVAKEKSVRRASSTPGMTVKVIEEVYALTVGNTYKIVNIKERYRLSVVNDYGYVDCYLQRAFEAPEIPSGVFRPTYKTPYRSSKSDFQRFLKKAGYRSIGEGAFGSVWSRPGSDFVIKVGGNLDDGWLKYAKLVMSKHRNNPFAPRIKYLKFFGDKNNRFYVAKIERLSSFDYSVEEAHNFYKMAKRVIYEDKGAYALSMRKLQKRHPELLKLVQDIRNHVLSEFNRDLHEQNIMMRGKQLVITDPASYRHTKAKEAKRATA